MKHTSLRVECRFTILLISVVALLAWAEPAPLAAQGTGSVRGTVTRADDGTPLPRLIVNVKGTRISGVTNAKGNYALPRVPAGQQIIVIRWLGYRPHEVAVNVTGGGTHTADAVLDPQPVVLSELVVTGVSRAPERLVEAPAAVSLVDISVARDLSLTAQAPRALANLTGADVAQSGMNDYNVNSRGFNSSLTRRMLVLQDGRDLAVAFLGSQEWNALTSPLEDISRIELVRGPGSALYGANAFSGVISMTTPTAREIVGTKLSVGGGELSTFTADLRHAGVSRDGRFGYKLNFGYNRSDTWTAPRTAFDGSDSRTEYLEANDDPITTGVTLCSGLTNCLAIEAIPLLGQTVDAAGRAVGDPDAVVNAYGSLRGDYYLDDGSVFTVEGGNAWVNNGVIVTGIGRVQIDKAIRPWARAVWAADRFNVMAWWAGRNALNAQKGMGSGLDIEDKSNIFHAEAQYNQEFLDGRGRVVVGASGRNFRVNTKQTLLPLADDDRSDWSYSAYGQVEYEIVPQLRVVGAGRYDNSNLYKRQFSPKGALVFSPNEDHSFRFSVSRAFQTPNQLEYFLRADFAAPTGGPDSLELGLEAYYAAMNAALGLTLPTDLPWNFDTFTRLRARGNMDLELEKVTAWEVGYKGNIADRAFVTLDVFYNRLSNFVTDLLPGVNPAQYPRFGLTDGGIDVLADLTAIETLIAQLEGLGIITPAQAAALRAPIPALEAGYNLLLTRTAGGAALATVNGVREIVVSYTNAGKVEEYGIEVGANVAVTPEFRLEGNYTIFEVDVDETSVLTGDQLKPNTPKHKVNLAASYGGRQGFDARVSAKFVAAYDWAAGAFVGKIPSSQTVDVSVGYQINPYARIHALATNVFDQQRYHIFGGSVIGRRVLGGITVTF